jgi:hypothetical protein
MFPGRDAMQAWSAHADLRVLGPAARPNTALPCFWPMTFYDGNAAEGHAALRQSLNVLANS